LRDEDEGGMAIVLVRLRESLWGCFLGGGRGLSLLERVLCVVVCLPLRLRDGEGRGDLGVRNGNDEQVRFSTVLMMRLRARGWTVV
jgi:hypothetical protein